MRYDPDIDRRRSIRLPAYDYSEKGAYFVTLVTAGRTPSFGAIKDDVVSLSAIGRIVEEELRRSAEIRRELELDALVVMPNHVHGIVFLQSRFVGGRQRDLASGRWGDQPVAPTGNVGGTTLRRFGSGDGPGRRSLGSFVGGFKAGSTTRINRHRETAGTPVWQRNYYERVIRDEDELERIREYVLDNPRRWAEDKHNPMRVDASGGGWVGANDVGATGWSP